MLDTIVKRKKLTKKKRGEIAFYCVMLAYPLLQFAIFYIGVNFNSILLSFESYDFDSASYNFVGLANFRKVFGELFSMDIYRYSLLNSLLAYGVTFLMIPLSLIFSYYMFKKFPLGGLFKVMLFLPSIVSSFVMMTVFRFFVEDALPLLIRNMGIDFQNGLLSNRSTQLGTIIFYNMWVSFGGSILMYLGAMNTISDSVIESARLEGAGFFREFFSIVLPLCYQTIITFIITGIAGIFINQLGLFAFYQTNAAPRLYTFGYVLYIRTLGANFSQYPELATLGILFTFVAVPLTLGVKYLLNKFGPSVD